MLYSSINSDIVEDKIVLFELSVTVKEFNFYIDKYMYSESDNGFLASIKNFFQKISSLFSKVTKSFVRNINEMLGTDKSKNGYYNVHLEIDHKFYTSDKCIAEIRNTYKNLQISVDDIRKDKYIASIIKNKKIQDVYNSIINKASKWNNKDDILSTFLEIVYNNKELKKIYLDAVTDSFNKDGIGQFGISYNDFLKNQREWVVYDDIKSKKLIEEIVKDIPNKKATLWDIVLTYLSNVQSMFKTTARLLSLNGIFIVTINPDIKDSNSYKEFKEKLKDETLNELHKATSAFLSTDWKGDKVTDYNKKVIDNTSNSKIFKERMLKRIQDAHIRDFDKLIKLSFKGNKASEYIPMNYNMETISKILNEIYDKYLYVYDNTKDLKLKMLDDDIFVEDKRYGDNIVMSERSYVKSCEFNKELRKTSFSMLQKIDAYATIIEFLSKKQNELISSIKDGDDTKKLLKILKEIDEIYLSISTTMEVSSRIGLKLIKCNYGDGLIDMVYFMVSLLIYSTAVLLLDDERKVIEK